MVQAAAGLCPGPPVLSGTGFAFRAGSEGVINAASLRLRGRLNRRQFYMPPVGGENLYNRASPDGKQANRPAGVEMHPFCRLRRRLPRRGRFALCLPL